MIQSSGYERYDSCMERDWNIYQKQKESFPSRPVGVVAITVPERREETSVVRTFAKRDCGKEKEARKNPKKQYR